MKISWEQLRDEANLPCIVHWNQQHFVVVYKIARKRGQWWVWVSDPASGLLKYTEEQFRKAWEQSRERPDIAELTELLRERIRVSRAVGCARIYTLLFQISINGATKFHQVPNQRRI